MDLDSAIEALGGGRSVRSIKTGTPPAWLALNAEEAAKQPQRDIDAAKLKSAERTMGDPASIPNVNEADWNKKAGFGEEGDLSGAIDALTKPIGKPKSNAALGLAKPGEKTAEDIFNPGSALRYAGSMVGAPGAAILGGLRGMGILATGGSWQSAVDEVNKTQEAVAFEPRNEQEKSFAEAAGSKWNPLNWLSLINKKAGETSADISSKLGASPEVSAGVGTAAETGLTALETIAGLKGANKAITLGDVGGQIQAPKVAPAIASTERLEIPAYVRRARGEKLGSITSPERAAQVGTVAKAAPVETAVNAVEPSAKASVLQRVGFSPEDRIRLSALGGDAKAASTDYQMGAKLDTEAGKFMQGVLERERQVLSDHGESIVAKTGGTLGLDQNALLERGGTILKPLEDLGKWFDDKTKALYKVADERAKGQSVALNPLHEALNDASMLTNSDRVHLQGAVNAYLKKLGMVDKEGNILGTAQQAETVRKYLNKEWTPQNSGFVQALKNSIDEGVTWAAGEDIYKEARALRTMRGSVLENPKGIAKLVDSEGINRAIDVEKIPDAITTMPVEQVRHVVQTLDNMPKELQPQAAAAKAEIKAHFANRILEQGNKNATQWNAKNVRTYLDKNAAKLNLVFNNEELAAINDLREAGNILHKDASYPGAAVQEHNLLKAGAMRAVRGGTAAVGAVLGGPGGAALGDLVGSAAAEKIGDIASKAAAKRRTVKLGDIAQ